MACDQPDRPGSRSRDDLAARLRSRYVESPRGAAAHVVYYLRGNLDDGRDGVIIARLLRERMETRRHLIRGLA